jgi:hypothetical protein
MSKKVLGIIIFVVIIIAAVVCVCLLIKPEKEISGTLEEIMEKVYAGIPQEELPMMLGNIELTEENIEGFIGTGDVKYTKAIANESMTGSIAHSVVLLRLENAADANSVVQKIKENVNPRKWICVEASKVIVKNESDIVILIMSSDELAPKLEANFNKL